MAGSRSPDFIDCLMKMRGALMWYNPTPPIRKDPVSAEVFMPRTKSMRVSVWLPTRTPIISCFFLRGGHLHAYDNAIYPWLSELGRQFIRCHFSHTLFHWFPLTNWPICLKFSMICYKTIFKTPCHVGNVWKMQAVSSAQTFYVASSSSCTYMLKMYLAKLCRIYIWLRIFMIYSSWLSQKVCFHGFT